MSTVTEERQPVTRAGSGVAVDPERVMAMRHIRLLTRQQLSDRIAAFGMTDDRDNPVRLGKDALGKIETGQRKPSIAAFAALAAALACDPVDLTEEGQVIRIPEWVTEKQDRMAENADLRMFAAGHGLKYVNPRNGRVYYSKPLRYAYRCQQELDKARKGRNPDRIAKAQEEFQAALANVRRAPDPDEGRQLAS